MDSSIVKGMLIVIVILYIISPVDLMPGLVDDAIVLLLGTAAHKFSKAQRPVFPLATSAYSELSHTYISANCHECGKKQDFNDFIILIEHKYTI